MTMDLFDYLYKYGPLEESLAKKVFRDICSAVKHCHSEGFIHRDIKLENILVKLDKQENIVGVYLSDFGLVLPNKTHTCSDGVSGTPAYIAPECLNNSGTFDSKADIWALGIVLYLLLVGFHPLQK